MHLQYCFLVLACTQAMDRRSTAGFTFCPCWCWACRVYSIYYNGTLVLPYRRGGRLVGLRVSCGSRTRDVVISAMDTWAIYTSLEVWWSPIVIHQVLSTGPLTHQSRVTPGLSTAGAGLTSAVTNGFNSWLFGGLATIKSPNDTPFFNTNISS